jgi:hypothetical protein
MYQQHYEDRHAKRSILKISPKRIHYALGGRKNHKYKQGYSHHTEFNIDVKISIMPLSRMPIIGLPKPVTTVSDPKGAISYTQKTMP